MVRDCRYVCNSTKLKNLSRAFFLFIYFCGMCKKDGLKSLSSLSVIFVQFIIRSSSQQVTRVFFHFWTIFSIIYIDSLREGGGGGGEVLEEFVLDEDKHPRVTERCRKYHPKRKAMKYGSGLEEKNDTNNISGNIQIYIGHARYFAGKGALSGA